MLFCRLTLILAVAAARGDLSSTADGFNRCFIDAAHRAKNSVVNIIIYERSPKDGPRES
jgi:hypothetical protein